MLRQPPAHKRLIYAQSILDGASTLDYLARQFSRPVVLDFSNGEFKQNPVPL